MRSRSGCADRAQRRCPRCAAAHLEAPVELGDVVLAQKRVGRLQGGDPVQPQLLRQPSLPGAEAALAASPRLRRVGRESSAPPARAAPVPPASADADPPASPAFGVSQKWLPRSLYKAQNTPLLLDHFSQSRHHRHASIPPPPVARSRSRCWRRPESRSGRTSARPETSDAGCRRCAAASPASGRRGRRLRCTPRLRPRATSPAPCSAAFTQL